MGEGRAEIFLRIAYDDSILQSSPRSVSLIWGRQPLGAVLRSWDESSELLQWHCHDDDSTMNIVTSNIITVSSFSLVLLLFASVTYVELL